MCKISFASRARLEMGVLLAILFLTTGVGRAQEEPLKDLYNKGMAAFQGNDFDVAIKSFEDLMNAVGGVDTGLQDVYFTLGAAYFNKADYKKALELFQKFQQKYPTNPRVPDVSLRIAQCHLMTKNYAEAVRILKELQNNKARPDLRELALLLEAQAYKEQAEIDKAIAVLVQPPLPEIQTNIAATAAILLMECYSEKEPAKAVAVLMKLQSKLQLVDNLVEVNSMAITLGDKFYERKQFAEALTCFQTAKTKPEIIAIQNAKIANLNAQIARNREVMLKAPDKTPELTERNKQIGFTIEAATKLLEEMSKVPDFGPKLFLRIAACYYSLEKKWEAIVVFEELLLRFPQAEEKDREQAAFSMIAVMVEVGSPESIQRDCNAYLAQFPTGVNADAVRFFLASSALQTQDYEGAEKQLSEMMAKQPDSKFRPDMMYQLANSRFMQGKYEEALADYKNYETMFPTGERIEDVTYHACVALMFSDKMDEARVALEAYIAKYPEGTYLSDARYRVTLCKYADAGRKGQTEVSKKYDEVIADCQKWEKDFAGNAQLGEVLALQGDAYAAREMIDEAIATYIRSYKAAMAAADKLGEAKEGSDQVLSYSIFEAEKWLQKKGQWDKISEMFQEFVKANPEHSIVPTALFWVGRALTKQGKTEEAKLFFAETIKKFITDRKKDAVELMLMQLAQLCSKKPPMPLPAATPKAQADASPVASPAETPPAKPEPPYFPAEELQRLLGSSAGESNPTAQARILFAQAHLAELRKLKAEHDKAFDEIASQFKPEDLSGYLLAQLGDYLLSKGREKKDEALVTKASDYFRRLMLDFPKSEMLDFAYAGLGQIAFDTKDYPKAMEYFRDAVDKAGATQKLKDVTLGKAKTLFALGKYEEAKPVFEMVAAQREWRSEATAESLYMLGEIEAQKGKWPEANAFYQRVYVGYQRYVNWVAKAYLRSGECYEKMSRIPEAVRTYKDMIEHEKLATLPEADEARKRLQQLGQQ